MNKVVLLLLTVILASPVWANVEPNSDPRPESVAIFQDYLGLTTGQLVQLAELRQDATAVTPKLARAVLTTDQLDKIDRLGDLPTDAALRARAEYFLLTPPRTYRSR